MTQHLIWTADGAAVAVAVIAGVADWRRSRRTDLDATGWVPWRGIQMVGIFAAIAFAILAVHARS